MGGWQEGDCDEQWRPELREVVHTHNHWHHHSSTEADDNWLDAEWGAQEWIGAWCDGGVYWQPSEEMLLED